MYEIIKQVFKTSRVYCVNEDVSHTARNIQCSQLDKLVSNVCFVIQVGSFHFQK